MDWQETRKGIDMKIVWTAVASVGLMVSSLVAGVVGDGEITLALGLSAVATALLSIRE